MVIIVQPLILTYQRFMNYNSVGMLKVDLSSLGKWLEKNNWPEPIQWQSIPPGAGKRSYLRLISPKKNAILMFIPQDAEIKLSDFLSVQKIFRQGEVRVPLIYSVNESQTCALIEDLGDQLYDKHITEANREELYKKALSALLKIQTCQPSADYGMSHFLSDHFFIDMELWREWFVEKLCNSTIPESIYQPLFSLLKTILADQPQVCIHRDYHARNLLWLKTHETGIVDFQNAMWGPLVYDLASLLRDSYVQLPQAFVQALVFQFFQSVSYRFNFMLPHSNWWKVFELTALQRNLKALGTFARKYIRDQEPNYLEDIQRTLTYITETAKTYAELNIFYEWFNPVCQSLALKRQ